MAIQVRFEYDARRNIVFTEDCGELASEADVDDFIRQYVTYFERLGTRAYVVSNIDQLVIQGAVAPYYGRRAKETVEAHLLGYARWGTNTWARMSVRTTSSMAKVQANIHSTREEAVRAVEAMQKAARDGG